MRNALLRGYNEKRPKCKNKAWFEIATGQKDRGLGTAKHRGSIRASRPAAPGSVLNVPIVDEPGFIKSIARHCLDSGSAKALL